MEIRIYASLEPKSERLMLFARTVGVRKRPRIERFGRISFRPKKVSSLGGMIQ